MYKQNNFLYVVKLTPAVAHKKILSALEGVKDQAEGRRMELAAAKLEFTATTLKRYIKLLKDQGYEFEVERKARADKAPMKPLKKSRSKKKSAAA